MCLVMRARQAFSVQKQLHTPPDAFASAERTVQDIDQAKSGSSRLKSPAPIWLKRGESGLTARESHRSRAARVLVNSVAK